MKIRRFLTSVIVLTACVWAAYVSVVAQQRGELAGMGRLSGTVTAPQPFKAGQVFIRNVDRKILYMVFTNGGQYRSLALFPGNYEVSVKARGLQSDVQKLVLRAGENATLRLAMQPGAGIVPAVATPFVSYDELYPPGPGKHVAEQACQTCHDENFLPARPASEAVWRARVGHMAGYDLDTRDSRSYNEGALAGRVQWFPFAVKDREEFVAYAVKHWGPDAKARFVRGDRDVPFDEATLSKAMFMEYYLPIDAPGTGSSSEEFAKQGRGIRWGQDVRFDADGNVWLTDRGYPHRLVKLDPRTGTQKDYLYPDGGKLGNHDLTIDRSGIVWAPEHSGLEPDNGIKRLLGFNPKTEQWQYKIPADPDNVVRNPRRWMQSMALDSKDNLYVGWIMGGVLTKLDRATQKVKVYPISDRGAVPYGVIADRNDNIWIALWNSGKLAKLDQRTGRFTEYSVPLWTSQPYDVNPDPEGNIWFADSPTPDRVALIGKFNPRTQAFSFYPKPQFAADSPKIQVTKDGAIWFSPRGSRNEPAISVLYPDMDKITTLGAFYQFGPPGNPWPTPATSQTASRGR